MNTFCDSFSDGRGAMMVKGINTMGCCKIKSQAVLSVTFDQFPYTRHYKPTQVLTYLGRVDAIVTGAAHSLDGFNAKAVTTDGTINIDEVINFIKTESGKQANVWASHIANVQSWDWVDSQTALLINAIRFAVLLHLQEESDSTDMEGHFPVYDDGHLTIDRDAVAFTAHYPRSAGVTRSWPGGDVDQHYPEVRNLKEYVPPADGDHIDCSGLNAVETLVIYAMLGTWVRTSRHRLDFDMPMLTDDISYRGTTDIRPQVLAWLTPQVGTPATPPAVPTSKVVWGAVHKYVAVNRLYSAYSAALGMVAKAAMTMLPETAEGQAWLKVGMTLHVPAFKASRGTYRFLTHGEAVSVSERSLREYERFSKGPEYLLAAAALLCQAYAVGHARRSMRYIAEDRPYDLLATEAVVLAPETTYAALASEGCGVAVPLDYLANLGMTYAEQYLPECDIRVQIASTVGSTAGYNIDATTNELVVHRLPEAGVPYMLLPLGVFGPDGPYQGMFKVSVPISRKTRRGAMMTPEEAWRLAWLARKCGYDVSVADAPFQGVSRYFASNENQWTHKPVPAYGYSETTMHVTDMVERANNFIFLPRYFTKQFNGEIAVVEKFYNVGIVNMGESREWRITYLPAPTKSISPGIELDVPTTMQYLRGYIVRKPQDFQFVGSVQAGLMGQATAEEIAQHAPAEREASET